MAKLKGPVITHTEVLSLAAARLREEIFCEKERAAEVVRRANLTGTSSQTAAYLEHSDERIEYLMNRLLAIEAMYLFETGTELGVAKEIQTGAQSTGK